MGTGYAGRFGDQALNCLKMIPDRKDGFRKNCAVFIHNGTEKARMQRRTQAFSGSFKELPPVFQHFKKQVFNE